MVASADDPHAGSDDSFDPRTWGQTPKPAEPQASPATTTTIPPTSTAARVDAPAASPSPVSDSLDPSTWGKTTAFKPAAPPAAGPQAEVETPKPSRRGLLLAGGGAAAVGVAAVAGVGGWFVFGRKGGQAAAANGEGVASGNAATAAASVQRQVMTLDGSGSIEAALSAQGLKPAAAQGAAKAADSVLKGATGELRLELATLEPAPGAPATVEARLVSLQAKRPDGSGVSVAPVGEGFAATEVRAATHAATQVVRGQVDAESFYTSAVSAGLSDALIPAFFQAFVYDFDFQREIEAGAVFEAAIGSTVNEEGSAIGARQLLYASMTTAKKSLALYRYTPAGAAADDPGWYDGAGRSIKRGLMRTPIEGARISSSFGWRTHPVLGFEKLHKGTDFAAPIGTPIYAAGDGTVEWAAMKGPNGNLTIIQHDNNQETYYLHQSEFEPGIVAGAKVHQGQTIGKVGTTGRSTGPHLHYELHINKEAVDAMAQPVGGGKPMDGPALAAFVKQRDAIDKLRASSL